MKKLLTASESSKLVEGYEHDKISLLILNKIRKAVSKGKDEVYISEIPGFDWNYADKKTRSKQQMYDSLNDDANGIKSLLKSKGYDITKKFLIKETTEQEVDAYDTSTHSISRFHRYEISW
jgi:hypothetical protein